MSTRIPISAVTLGEQEEQLVLSVLRSGRLAQGPMVEALERRFAELCGVEHAVAVNSGTTALVAALRSLGIGPGDEVLTSPFTFVATLNAILEVGATATFADIDPETFTLDPADVERRITSKTRVVLPVHLYGQPADMGGLQAVAKATGAVIVEDAAQAHAAAFGERPVGSFGIGCFSLYATKNIAAGEGGIVTTNNAEIADRLRLLRNHGMRRRYEYEIQGNNYRLTEMQAALTLPQLDRLADSTARRRLNAARLSEGLDGLGGLVTPGVAAGREHVFHQYTIRVTAEARHNRDVLAAKLSAMGIDTGVYYPRRVHDYDCYRNQPSVVDAPTPVADRAAAEVLSLPVHAGLTDTDVDRIVKAVRTCLQ
ncbi:MAG: DegT/DnrJ/EryC1/StrS family aminotransferase [Actinomycetota bacterium]|jgi:perosamine synthetase